MKNLGTVIGAAIAGMFIMSVWGVFVQNYGIVGGWFAGMVLVGGMWFLNHHVGVFNNDGAWVDMAMGIGIAGTSRDIFSSGIWAGIHSLPTIGVVVAGGVTGGIVAVMVERSLSARKKVEA